MSSTQLQVGTEIAYSVPNPSSYDKKPTLPVKTTGDLLAILKEKSPRSFRMVRSACAHLAHYFDMPGDQIPLDLIEDRKRGFRPFLETRRYQENTIRTYVFHQRRLLQIAASHGWSPDGHSTEAWKPLLELAAEKHLTDITRHFSRATKSPAEVTADEVDRWGEARIRDGYMFTTIATKKNRFWRLLQKSGWISTTPRHMLKLDRFGIPAAKMPERLRNDIQTVLKWKQAEFARNRPKNGKIRRITADNVRISFQQLTGFVVNVCGGSPQNLSELLQQEHIERFVEWLINERHVKGLSVQVRLTGVLAIVKHHPMFAGQDFYWFNKLLDSISVEDASVRKRRKASKYIDYDELESIPGRIRAFREVYGKQKKKKRIGVAQLAMEEFIFRWFLVLPWRQRNLRECRIGGRAPNLFKGKIPPISAIDKPTWVKEEEDRNPDAEFWMICFTPDDTKTHIPIDLLLPKQLIEPLEEYLAIYRPMLLDGKDSEMLFVTPRGKKMTPDQVGKVIGHWTTKFATHRTTPHLLRDALAHRWLREHPQDYLTLSKLLWHKNLQTTIQIYGARFNESSGACAMERWLDQRRAYQK